MQRIRVRHRFRAPVEDVFALIADHEGYAALPGVRRATLIRTGHDDRNGEGAVREIELVGGLRIVETITAYQPPYRLEYRIVEAPIPLEHKGARVELTPSETGTTVVWTSRLRCPVPLAGGPLALAVRAQLTVGFAGALRFWDRRLRRTAAAAR